MSWESLKFYSILGLALLSSAQNHRIGLFLILIMGLKLSGLQTKIPPGRKQNYRAISFMNTDAKVLNNTSKLKLTAHLKDYNHDQVGFIPETQG